MKVTIQPAAELDRLHKGAAPDFAAGLRSYARALLEKRKPTAARDELYRLLVTTQTYADLLARGHVHRYRRSAARAQKFAEPEDVPAVPFDQAIKDFISRTPELARTAPEVLDVYMRHGFTLVKATELEVVQKVQKFLKAVIEQGTTENRATAVLDGMGDWTRAYAETVVRNAQTTAYSAGTFREMANPDVQAVIGGLKYRAVGDSDTRPNHLAAQGLIAAHDDPVWNECAPPCGHRCVLPDTLVSGAIEAALKSWYSGPAVVIETASGARLSVTVNHPVLASGRWKPAHLVQEGDHLLRHGSDFKLLDLSNRLVSAPAMTGRAVDDEQGVARAADLFHALRREAVMPLGNRWTLSRVPVLPEDFHGDGGHGHGDVEQVGPNRVLPRGLDSAGPEQEEQLVLVESAGGSGHPGQRSRPADPLCLGRHPSRRALPGGPALTADDLDVVRSGATLSPLQTLRVGPAAEIDVVALEERRYSSAADPEFVRELQDARPGLVTSDKVLRVRRIEYSGHVYDFQTRGGWMLADRIVVSNCRCGLRFVDWLECRALGLVTKAGRLRRATVPRGFYRDPGFGGGRPDLTIYG